MSNRLGGFIAGQNINVSIGTFTAVTSPTFTFASTQATPAVGQAVQFTTTGTLPTGLSINTTYYVISVSTNTCQFSTTQGGSAVTFTNSSGSGTHTAVTQRAFTPYAGAPDTVEYLVVAGGGGGGGVSTNSYGRGGGGAGGLLTATNYAVTPGSAIIVTIGSGGTAGSNGSNSVFGSITATGGGSGGYSAGSNAGANGGSGGGGAGEGSSQPGGTGVSGQGNSGGAYATSAGNTCGAGGGGAGSIGTSARYSASNIWVFGGEGGAGLVSAINGTPIQYAAGGGGGVGYITNPGTSGGLGGASGATGQGNGGNLSNGIAGNANTGNGGGGASGASTWFSGAGGSGIVIIRYPQINAAPALVTGSPQVNYADGYQIYTWTSSGSIIF